MIAVHSGISNLAKKLSSADSLSGGNDLLFTLQLLYHKSDFTLAGVTLTSHNSFTRTPVFWTQWKICIVWLITHLEGVYYTSCRGYIVFVCLSVCSIVRSLVRLFVCTFVTTKFWLKSLSVTTYQKAFIFGSYIAWRVVIHIMTPDLRVPAPVWVWMSKSRTSLKCTTKLWLTGVFLSNHLPERIHIQTIGTLVGWH